MNSDLTKDDSLSGDSISGRAGKVIFWTWFAVFVLGAAGELLGLSWLTKLTDVKSLFLN